MSMFGSIMSTIFGHPAATAAPNTTSSQPAAAPPPAAAPAADGAAPTSSASAPSSPVDVGAVLASMASEKGQALNYKTSITDLLKLLGLDSSLEARKTLAGELHYTGNMDDSASMNIWLHQEVMTKLAENGGVVPADLKGG